MKPEDIDEDLTSSNIIDWRHRNTSKELYQRSDNIVKLQEHQQLKYKANITRLEKKDIVKMLTFHTIPIKD